MTRTIIQAPTLVCAQADALFPTSEDGKQQGTNITDETIRKMIAERGLTATGPIEWDINDAYDDAGEVMTHENGDFMIVIARARLDEIDIVFTTWA